MKELVDKHSTFLALGGTVPMIFYTVSSQIDASRIDHLVPTVVISLLTHHYCLFPFPCSFTCPFWIYLLNKLPAPKSLEQNLLLRETQLKQQS